MKQSSKISLVCGMLLAVSACQDTPGTYGNKGDPENMIDVSSEVSTFSLASKSALTKLSNMVAQDRPARADLSCSFKDTRCTQAKEIFDRNNVPVKVVGDNKNTVTLTYQRVVARDCNPRYIDNSINSRNLNHPAFGCSVAGNMVQMVSDKKQFTNPNLLDFPDAEKSTQYYQQYLTPPQAGARSLDGSGMKSGLGDVKSQ